MKKIPLVDLRANYLSIKSQIDEAISKVFENTSFIGGPILSEFESNFAKKCNAKYCIGVSSGTSAIQLAIEAYKLKYFLNKYPDESMNHWKYDRWSKAITVSNTFIATVESAWNAKCDISFVDVNENGLINTKLLEQKVEEMKMFDLDFVIPVHLYGQVCDMDEINRICKNKCHVIEDCAQSHFSRYSDGSVVGSKNTCCFSFFPGKSLGSFGDAGAITTNDPEIASLCKKLRNHGRDNKFDSDVFGYNYRMDTLQAAILNVKLNHIDEWNDKRRNIVKLYNEKLSSIKDIIIPKYDENYAYHLYVIRTPKRDELLKFLNENEIECGIHYKIPVHQQKVAKFLMKSLSNKESLPVTEKLSNEILSLPIYPELQIEDVEYICTKIKEFFNKC